MAAWTATAIRNRHPDAFIAWAVESRCMPVVDTDTLVSQVSEIPRDKWKADRWSPQTWRDQMVTYARFRSQKFDYGIDLQGHSKTALCLRIANPKQRISAAATDSLAAKLNPVHPGRKPETHTIDWQHEVLSTLGDFGQPRRPIMPTEGFAPKDRRMVTISVSAGAPEKAYPNEHWRTIARYLRDQAYDVHFLGGPTDIPIQLEEMTDHVGKLPLAKSMELVARSRLHLCADTGTGHMAAAYGVPVVSVFGPTDPAVYRPYTDTGLVLKNGNLTTGVSPIEVIEAAEGLLALPY